MSILDTFPVSYYTSDLGQTGIQLSSLLTFESTAAGVIVSGYESSLMFSLTDDFAANADSQIVRDSDYTYQLTWSEVGTQTIYLARPYVDGEYHYLAVDIELLAAPTDLIFDDFIYQQAYGWKT